MNDQSFGALTRNVATIFKNPSYLLSEFTRLFFHELKVDILWVTLEETIDIFFMLFEI